MGVYAYHRCIIVFLMQKILRSLIICCAVGCGITACVETFDTGLPNDARVLVVDGIITDLPERQVISIRRSEPNGLLASSLFVTAAAVDVIINNTQTVRLTEISPGQYALPEGFRGKVGDSYQLKFRLSDGQQYSSTIETMPASVPVGEISQSFDPKALSVTVKTTTTFIPANILAVDIADPAGIRNFYRWKWTLWEMQEYCASCSNSLYQTSVEDCVRRPGPSSPTVTIFDYRCATPCWDIFRSTEVIIYTDTYSDGRQIRQVPVGKIPFYQSVPALVEIQQASHTAGAHRYYTLLEQQTQRTGGLADTPPAAIIGNVTNTTMPEDNVVGYFTAASVQTKRHYLDRSGNRGAQPIGFTGGRNYNMELPSLGPDSTVRPPLATCKPAFNRTPVRPQGWR